MGVYVHTYCQKSVLIVGTFHYIKNVLSYYNNYQGNNEGTPEET